MQAMPPSMRTAATAGIGRLLAPGGSAIVIQFVRGNEPADDGPPWLLDEAEMRAFEQGDVRLRSLSTAPNPRNNSPVPIWVGHLHRD